MSEIDEKTPINFSKAAIAEIERLLELEDKAKILHIGVKDGGCSGFTYVFEFIENADAFDVYKTSNFKYAVNSLDLKYIKGLELDYEQGLNNRGFTFTNPNASTTCGCGTSFA